MTALGTHTPEEEENRSMPHEPTPSPSASDLDAIRDHYRRERDKRRRADGYDQYAELEALPAHFVEDPHVTRAERAPRKDSVAVVVIGGGFSGLVAGAR